MEPMGIPGQNAEAILELRRRLSTDAAVAIFASASASRLSADSLAVWQGVFHG